MTATATDQAGNDTHHEYDLAGRQTKVTRGYGSSTPSATTYAYDDANRKTSETDALGRTTSSTYDAIKQLVTRATPALTILPVSALQDESQLEPTAQCAH